MSLISTKLISEALLFYSQLGYEMIDVPMLVDLSVSAMTKPKNKKDLYHNKKQVYCASAEQSFIQLYNEGKLAEGRYMAITPCYRDEKCLDDTHFKMFVKIELIDVGNCNVFSVIKDAQMFLSTKTSKIVNIIKTLESENSYDLEINDIEVGSYGLRFMPDGKPYLFGTGLAEPRTTHSINLK